MKVSVDTLRLHSDLLNDKVIVRIVFGIGDMNDLTDFESVFFRDKSRGEYRILIRVDFCSRSRSRVIIRSNRLVRDHVTIEDPSTSEKSLHAVYRYDVLYDDANIFIRIVREFYLRIRGKRRDRSISDRLFIKVKDEIDRTFSDEIFDSDGFRDVSRPSIDEDRERFRLVVESV